MNTTRHLSVRFRSAPANGLVIGLAVTLSCFLMEASAQCPACANPSLSGGERSKGKSRYDKPIPLGRLRLDVNFQYHALTRLVHGDDYVSFSELMRRSPEAAEHGDAESYVFQSDLIGRYALTDYTELFVDIPYKVLTMRVDVEDEHHRDETFQGPGDIPIGIKHFLLTEDSFQLAGIAGLTLPVGRLNKITAASYLSHREADELGITELPEHHHLQLGTGTFDPFVGAEALYRFNGHWLSTHWMFFGSFTANLPFYENRYDYEKSPSANLTLGPAARITNTGIITGLFIEFFYSGRDRLESDDIVGSKGVLDGSFDVPNTGRFESALAPTVTWAISNRLTLNMEARIPIYTRIKEDSEQSDVQLTEHIGGFLGFSYHY